MASKSICTRCLRAARTTVPSSYRPLIHRAFLSTTLSSPPLSAKKQSRKIHHSAQQNAATATATASSSAPGAASASATADESRVLLQPNNLFHSFTNSPSPVIRRRAAYMRQNAYCSHPDHQATRAVTSPHDLEARKIGASPPAHVKYECPDCGIPVSCSEEHFVDDYESHLEICDLLKEINQDDHDLHSGRFFPEFEYPPAGMDEAQVNLTNWDTMLYSREFTAVNDERSMRQVTRLLTYPITIGSILHELSPYTLKDKLLPEGLRSLSGKFSYRCTCWFHR